MNLVDYRSKLLEYAAKGCRIYYIAYVEERLIASIRQQARHSGFDASFSQACSKGFAISWSSKALHVALEKLGKSIGCFNLMKSLDFIIFDIIYEIILEIFHKIPRNNP